MFNTPIVLYTHRPILEAFQNRGLVTERDGAYVHGHGRAGGGDRGWHRLGGSGAAGALRPPWRRTPPTRCAPTPGICSRVCWPTCCAAGWRMRTAWRPCYPRLKAIFEKLGYMEASSSDLFDQFLKTGMGAKPVIAGYENQLLEFAVENPEDWAQLKDDIVLITPPPPSGPPISTSRWTRRGEAGIDALLDEEVQRLAWKITASAPRYPARTPTKTTSASLTWPRRSPRWPPCPATPPWRRSSPLCRNVNFTAGLDKCAVQREAFSQMDGLIVYGSKYGTTRRYAEELSRLTGLPAIPCGEFHRLAEGSILVYLGALYAGGVLGLKQAMKGTFPRGWPAADRGHCGSWPTLRSRRTGRIFARTSKAAAAGAFGAGRSLPPPGRY